MRKFLAVAGVLTSVVVTGTAFAQEETTAAPEATTTAAPAAAPADAAEKKIGVGADVMFVLPLGDFADASGPQIGAVARVGYRVMPALELTGRVGYLHGLSKEQSFSVLGTTITSKTSISNIPIWVGARYFFMQPTSGLYGAAEIGANMLSAKAEVGGQSSSSDTETRFGFNVGAGYVISESLPIDIRAQFMHHNLLGTEDGEKSMLGLGFSVGYTAMF